MSEQPDIGYGDELYEEGICDCGKGPWDLCDCGEFFLNWVCGMRADGSCSLAGTEDCDWECPRK